MDDSKSSPFTAHNAVCYWPMFGLSIIRHVEVLGNVVISKKILRTRKIMVMHNNERGECRPRTLVDHKRKRYENAVDVVVCLHDPTDPSIEHTAPSSSAHVQLNDVPRTHDPTELRGRVPSARRRDDGDDDATNAGHRLSTTITLSRWIMVEGGTAHG